MIYLYFLIHAPQTGAKMPPWHWRNYPAQSFLRLFQELFFISIVIHAICSIIPY